MLIIEIVSLSLKFSLVYEDFLVNLKLKIYKVRLKKSFKK